MSLLLSFDDDEIYNLSGLSNQNLIFYLSPYSYSEGNYKLTLNAIFDSATGSLANLMGYDAYTGELSWNVMVIRDLEKYSTSGYRINEDGFLEISWDNSVIPEKDIAR